MKLCIVIIMLSFLSFFASAKDLTHRLGVGYKDQFADEIPGVAAQYYPNPDFGISAALGIDTLKDNSKFGLMVKAMRIIFREDNMNFYMGGGVGLLSVETAGDSKSGFELNGFAGGEFFLPGLESLGFTFEAGVGVTSVDETRFRTYGHSPVKAGIIFYF